MAPHSVTNSETSPTMDSTSSVRRKNNARGGWIIQKFGGTSVGKFPQQIAENIAGYVTKARN
jgi:aspartate kinase